MRCCDNVCLVFFKKLITKRVKDEIKSDLVKHICCTNCKKIWRD